MNLKSYVLSCLISSILCFCGILSTYGQSTYVYIVVHDQLAKKMGIHVDFGDEPEQLRLAEEFQKALKEKKTFASILNYMDDRGYELIETRDLFEMMMNGNGRISGIQLIMKKKEE